LTKNVRSATLEPMTTAEKVLAVLRKDGLDGKRVAKAAGIPYNTLRGYIKPHSQRLPTAPKGLALAKALGVSPVWLFDDSQGLPPVPYRESPPGAINPWPPDGITWEEVKAAVHLYVKKRTEKYLGDLLDQEVRAEVDDKGRVTKLLIGPPEYMPVERGGEPGQPADKPVRLSAPDVRPERAKTKPPAKRKP